MADRTRTALDKTALRRSMREQRRALLDRPVRSLQIWEHVRSIPAVASAQRLMVFDAVPGEPETAPFVEWCRADGREVALPDDDVDPAWPDAVIVPGLAFTASGDRLGQGGGWYDRFLAVIRPECTTIGVGFDIQLVDRLPVESHDVALDHVVTESGVASRSADH
jgi:5-formyltetrahydrofolate cyclo-ligase